MIEKVRLIRNIGVFESADGASIRLRRLTVVHAENGRGKTTLVAVLRSLATGDPIPVRERRRLGASNPPHAVLECGGASQPVIFQDGAWNRQLPGIVVFDDVFVSENVCSGLEVESGHRENLHELILGARGVALSAQLRGLVSRVEEHNTALRTKGNAIPASDRGSLSVDAFCALSIQPSIDAAIDSAERELAAANQRQLVQITPTIDSLDLPSFDTVELEALLGRNLPELDSSVAARVQAHLSRLGEGGESWVAEGVELAAKMSGSVSGPCPFCAQDLAGSSLSEHYRVYFGESYAAHRHRIADSLEEVASRHSGDARSTFERAVRVARERRQFWAQYCNVPQIDVDTESLSADWRKAEEAVLEALSKKQDAPLDAFSLSDWAREALKAYEGHRRKVEGLNLEIQRGNDAIDLAKGKALSSDPRAIAERLTLLRAAKARHSDECAPLCDAYLSEKMAKAATEQERDRVRSSLDEYRRQVFPAYQQAVNHYLGLFGAGFSLDSVRPGNTRAGSTCSYCVVINNTQVSVSGSRSTSGEPSFRTTLSAGDRNAIALAFFFASLDQEPDIADRIVVIDDPASSLDEHRSVATAQVIRCIARTAAQVIVLSHSEPFLCSVFERADSGERVGVDLVRDNSATSIRLWNVGDWSLQRHDRLRTSLSDYVRDGSGDRRKVAEDLRPFLEGFLRVACCEHFPPKSLIGPFLRRCRDRCGTNEEILCERDVLELDQLTEYANRFHHDTNPGWETETVNDGELTAFTRRALQFARK